MPNQQEHEVDIIKIDLSEMPSKGANICPLCNGSHPGRPEFDAVRALKVGAAIKFPCSWKHPSYARYQCSSFTRIKQIFFNFGEGCFLRRKTTFREERERRWELGLSDWKGRWVCQDGWVYVYRYE